MAPRIQPCLSAAAILLLVSCPAAEVDAAAAQGRAGATVIAPSTVTISSVSIVMAAPPIVAPVSTGASFATLNASAAAMSGEAPAVATIAGLTVSTVDGGNALSFSVAGDTTSAFVVQLAQGAATPAASTTSASAASAASPGTPGFESRPGAGAAAPPGLILATQALNGNGRLSIVLTQAPSDLVPNAVSLSVNYN